MVDEPHRVACNISGYDGVGHIGCYAYWDGQDLGGVWNNVAINAMVYSTEPAGKRPPYIPPLSFILRRG